MLNIDLIIFIVKTGFVTLLLVGGIYLLALSRQKCSNVASNLFGVRDLEITTGNIVFLKVLGGLLSVVGLVLIWYFFIYNPGAAASK